MNGFTRFRDQQAISAKKDPILAEGAGLNYCQKEISWTSIDRFS